MSLKAIFLDRDGTLNVDVNYLYKIEDFAWVPEAREALAYLVQQGYTLFVITNQSGIARGYYTIAQMEQLHEHMNQELARVGAHIEKFYYCPHHQKEGVLPEYVKDCDCRKPKPGMLLQAMAEYDIDKSASLMIGDSKRDVEAAEAAGIRGVQYKGGSLLEFVKQALAQ